jgi:chemotaxis signal transduction protein
MQPSTSPFTEVSTQEVPLVGIDDQYIRVRVGELELAMNTEHLSGVHQVSRQNRLTDKGTVLTSKGEFPVIQLGKILSQKLNRDIDYAGGKALIAVETGEDLSMIQVDSVSRPAKIRPEHVHPVAHVTIGTDRDLFRSVVNIAPSSANPNDSIRLCFDPRVAVGQTIAPEPEDKPNPLPKEATSAIAVAVAASKNRRGATSSRTSDQLLAFIPEDIAKGEIEHIFCLPLTAIAEVITRQPNLNNLVSNEVFEGFILWRKVPVPVVRLGKIFGFNANEDVGESRRLVVARAPGNRFIGFYAKSQMQTMKVPESVSGSSRAFSGRPHLGCFRTELGEVVVPDLVSILNGNF